MWATKWTGDIPMSPSVVNTAVGGADVGKTIAERFWAKVDKSGECWLWTASKRLGGYGQFFDGTTIRAAHRVAYELATNGPLPPTLYVLHACDNPPCVRPDHLFLGTQADNLADMTAKGRRARVGSKGMAHPRRKLNEDDVRFIRLAASGGARVASLVERFGITDRQVRNIIQRKQWAHV